MNAKSIRLSIVVILTAVCLIVFYITQKNSTYQRIFSKHKENISDKWSNYLDVYELYLSPYINKNASILEIGVQNGGHLQILKKYLRNAKVYGIDINQDVCKLDLHESITTFCFDATKENLINDNIKDLNLDVIIDDGSHNSPDVIKTFQIMFDRIKPGGLYIVEDTHASYWEEYGGGYKKPESQIEYFKSLIDILNAYHITNGLIDRDYKFINSLSDIEKNFLKWIDSIAFYDSMVVIKKLKLARPNQPYKRIVTGVKQPIFPVKQFMQ